MSCGGSWAGEDSHGDRAGSVTMGGLWMVDLRLW